MALAGVLKLFAGTPVHPVGPDGRMALSDHLRELRARVLRVVVAFLVALAVAFVFFDPIYDFVYGPYRDAVARLPEGSSLQTTEGAAGGLMLYLRLCGFTAVVVTAPIWLYQIWAFIMPGLHAHEKRWTYIFLAVATPLFAAGILLAYLTLPKGLEVLIGINPEDVTNLLESSQYLQFFTRTLIAFGLAFEIPVFVILLNLAGVVSGRTLGAYRAWIIVGTFVFAAVATPSTDPFTMTFMALPMIVLFLLSEVIARFNDRRREARNPYAGLSPDEAAPIR